jgi:geranylgeranyl pyrophosphate synthase
MISEAIQKALKKSVNHPELYEVMEYAVFPAGKLFRPKLIEAIALDLHKNLSANHLHLASAVEIHHAYTLVHDDLPSMDNDLLRRGKPSTHAKFGEWKAILGGDGLLVASFNALSEIRHQNFQQINKLMLWSTGAKGLILGQFKDLGANGKLCFQEILRVHELKTARLIQLSTLGTYLLSENISLKGKKDFLKLGREIGVTFQLLDDLSELTESKVSEHERSINPFITFQAPCLHELQKSHSKLSEIITQHNLQNLKIMLQDYFEHSRNNILDNFENVQENLGDDLGYLKSWITNFA